MSMIHVAAGGRFILWSVLPLEGICSCLPQDLLMSTLLAALEAMLRFMLLPQVGLMAMVCAATGDHGDVCDTCLLLQSTSMYMGHVAASCYGQGNFSYDHRLLTENERR